MRVDESMNVSSGEPLPKYVEAVAGSPLRNAPMYSRTTRVPGPSACGAGDCVGSVRRAIGCVCRTGAGVAAGFGAAVGSDVATGVAAGAAVSLGATVTVGVAVGEGSGVGFGFLLGVAVGSGDAVGAIDADGDGDTGGVASGSEVGACATCSVFGGPLKTRASA